MQRQPLNLKNNRLSLPPEAVQKSPTLARVHRVTLKLEEPQFFNLSTLSSNEDEEEQAHRLSGGSSLVFEEASSSSLIKGSLLTQVQGTFFRRWKERYFLLTKDFLSCFKLAKNGPSTMGVFLFKIRLAEVKTVEWSNSRSDALGTITVQLGPILVSPVDDIRAPNFQKSSSTKYPNEQRAPILLRAPLGVKEAALYDWFEAIEENAEASKSRRAARSASFGNKEALRSPALSTLVTHNKNLF